MLIFNPENDEHFGFSFSIEFFYTVSPPLFDLVFIFFFFSEFSGFCGFCKWFLLEKGRKSGPNLDRFLYGFGHCLRKKRRKKKEDSAGFE